MALNHLFEWENVIVSEPWSDYDLKLEGNPEDVCSVYESADFISNEIFSCNGCIGSAYANWYYEHSYRGYISSEGIVGEDGTELYNPSFGSGNEFLVNAGYYYQIGMDTYENPLIADMPTEGVFVSVYMGGNILCGQGILNLYPPYTSQELTIDAASDRINIALSRLGVKSTFKVYSPDNTILINETANTDYSCEIDAIKGIYTFEVTPHLMPNETRTYNINFIGKDSDSMDSWNLKGIFENTKPALFYGRRGIKQIN